MQYMQKLVIFCINRLLHPALNKECIRFMMRASFFILAGVVFAAQMLLAAPGYSQGNEQKIISLHFTNAPIQKVFSAIEDKADVVIMYENTGVLKNARVSISIKDKKVSEVLDLLLKNKALRWNIRENMIRIEAVPVQDFPNQTYQIALTTKEPSFEIQQPLTITGRVTDVSGAPLQGVTVMVRGTTNGAMTNRDGRYSLSNVPDDAILTFSFVGMEKKEISVSGKMEINVTMIQEAVGMSEVVAVGYGTMKKSDLTGSLSSISSKSIQNQPMNDFSQVLQGRAAGVIVTNSTGAPGNMAKIRIRGANSINGSNDPLYVIDGVPTVSDINPINPYDVKSVEILKDASATAIYGSRGANGVILITTKRGDAGAPKIELSSNISFSSVGKRYDMLDEAAYATLANETYHAEMFTPSQIAAFGNSRGTDWQNEIFSTGLSQNHQASVSGGSEKVRYLFSGNYVNEVGVLENSNRKTAGFRANIDAQFSKRFSLKMGITALTSSQLNPNLGSGGGKTNPILQSLMWSPTVTPYDATGNYTNQDPIGALGRNPVLLEKVPYYKTHRQEFGIITNLKYDLTDDLNIVGILSGQPSSGYNRIFTSALIQGGTSRLDLNSGYDFSWQVQTLLNYKKTFKGAHNVLFTAGFEESQIQSRDMALVALGVDNPTADISLASGSTVHQGYQQSGLQSYFGRLNYNYASKYYLTVTYRADGSSVFLKGNRFSYFPSVGLAWMLSEESFIKDLNVFDRLKLRGSWGITGNQSGVSPTVGLSSLSTKNYDYGTGTNYPGTQPNSPANTGLRWERTTQRDLGIDAAFFRNRLEISMDYYLKETHDVILAKQLPLYDGGYTVMQNIGQVNNKGFEMSVDYQAVNRRGFEWNIGFNLSTVRNKVIDLGLDPYILTGDYGSGITSARMFVIQPGSPLGSFWGVRYLGLWDSHEAEQALLFGNQPGDSKYEDLNGDHVINSSDYQIIGHAAPKYTFGINNTFTYKNFTFNVLISSEQGRQVLNLMYAVAAVPIPDSRTITLKDGADIWSGSNPNAAFPAQNPSNVNNMNSSRWLQNGSYIKVRNISISYNLPRHVTRFADLRLSVSAQNIFTLTKYKGYDPEVSNSGDSDTEAGIDFGAYPMPRLITAGVTLIF